MLMVDLAVVLVWRVMCKVVDDEGVNDVVDDVVAVDDGVGLLRRKDCMIERRVLYTCLDTSRSRNRYCVHVRGVCRHGRRVMWHG
jgi:hypothetical protein